MIEKQSRKQTATYVNLQNDQSGQPQQGKPRKPSLHARWKTMGQAMRMEIREHKSSFAVYAVLRILVLVMAVLQFFNGNYENVFLCILTLLLLLAPAFIQVRFRIELPSVLEVIVLVFVFSSEILGEISSFYEIFPFWDTVLHTMNGFLAAAIGFSLVDLLNRSSRVKFELSPLYLAIVSFCFSMTIGVIWEFFEFGMDQMFGVDMQKDAIVHSISSVMLDPTHTNHVIHLNDITQAAVNGHDLGLGGYLDIGLIDTMEDLIVNFIGAVVFSVFGFLYVKNRGKKDSIISRFVPQRKSADRDYLRLVIDGGSAADAKAKVGGVSADDSANASAAGTDSADAAGAKAGNADAAPDRHRPGPSPPSLEHVLRHFRSVETVVPGDRHVLLEGEVVVFPPLLRHVVNHIRCTPRGQP